MSLRELPVIDAKAFGDMSGVSWPLREDAVAKWPHYATASETADNSISILDVIGKEWDGGGVTAKRIASALRAIGDRDVVVNVNSPGGSFFEGVAIYNLLRKHPSKITVNVIGLAASAASVIAMAGDEIRIAKSAFMMLHNAWGVCVGNKHDMVDVSKTLDQFDAAMRGVYADRSGIDEKEIGKIMDGETWFSGKAAIDAGLADSLLQDDEVEDSPKALDNHNHIKARLLVENALMQQGKSRRERRALLADLKGGKPSAAANVKPSADDWVKAAKGLIEKLNMKG